MAKVAQIRVRRGGAIRSIPRTLPIIGGMDKASLGAYVTHPATFHELKFSMGEHGTLRLEGITIRPPQAHRAATYQIFGRVMRLYQDGAPCGPEGPFVAGDDDVYAMVEFDRNGENGVVTYGKKPYVTFKD